MEPHLTTSLINVFVRLWNLWLESASRSKSRLKYSLFSVYVGDRSLVMFLTYMQLLFKIDNLLDVFEWL